MVERAKRHGATRPRVRMLSYLSPRARNARREVAAGAVAKQAGRNAYNGTRLQSTPSCCDVSLVARVLLAAAMTILADVHGIQGFSLIYRADEAAR